MPQLRSHRIPQETTASGCIAGPNIACMCCIRLLRKAASLDHLGKSLESAVFRVAAAGVCGSEWARAHGDAQSVELGSRMD